MALQQDIDGLNWFDFLRKIKNILSGLNNKVNISGLPVYADNAAAIAGGLKVDDLYKTAGGELRIRI